MAGIHIIFNFLFITSPSCVLHNPVCMQATLVAAVKASKNNLGAADNTGYTCIDSCLRASLQVCTCGLVLPPLCLHVLVDLHRG